MQTNEKPVQKTPPSSVDAEQYLISGVLNTKDSILDCRVAARDFYQKEHRLIWEAAQELVIERKPVDVLTISERLKAKKTLADAGGIQYLTELMDTHMSAANLPAYADIVRGKAKERSLIILGRRLDTIGYDEGTTDDKIAAAEQHISGFMRHIDVGERKASALWPIAEERLAALEERNRNPGKAFMGHQTGFQGVDAKLGGMPDGSMIIVAGRPASGKTTISINICCNFARRGQPAIIFSLEMTRDQIVDKMICYLAKVNNERYRTGQLQQSEWEAVNAAGSLLQTLPIYIDDDPHVTSEQLCSKAKRICYQYGFAKPGVVMADYMQIMGDKNKDPVQRVTDISKNIKTTARELECPVLALSQLNRGLESRPDKRPKLSDLRDSGSLEQDGDQIIMLYRDVVYNPDTDRPTVAEVLIRKNKYGPIGEVEVSAYLHRDAFEDLAPQKSFGGRPIPPPDEDMFQQYDV